MSTTDGEVVVRFFVPLRTGRGENNREVRGQRIARIQRERDAVFWAWPRESAHLPHRGAADRVRVLVPVRAPCVVTFTRVAPGRGLDPEENLPGSLKAIKDEVAEILGADDRDPRITWKYEQERGEWGVRIHIAATLAGPTVVEQKPAPRAPKKLKARKVKPGGFAAMAAQLKPAFVPGRSA